MCGNVNCIIPILCMHACMGVYACMCTCTCTCVYVCSCVCMHVCTCVSYLLQCMYACQSSSDYNISQVWVTLCTKQQLNNILVSIVYGTVEGSLAILYVNVYTCVCVMCMCMHVHACVVSGWAYSPLLKWQEYHLILWWADTVYYLELIMNCVTTISNNHCYLHI